MSERLVYFINEAETTEDGQYIPCIAVEGETGCHRTDWDWGKDLEKARAWANQRNKRMGISLHEATKIQLATRCL